MSCAFSRDKSQAAWMVKEAPKVSCNPLGLRRSRCFCTLIPIIPHCWAGGSQDDAVLQPLGRWLCPSPGWVGGEISLTTSRAISEFLAYIQVKHLFPAGSSQNWVH